MDWLVTMKSEDGVELDDDTVEAKDAQEAVHSADLRALRGWVGGASIEVVPA